MVRKHDPAGADANRVRHARDLADDDLGRRAREPAGVVMLREPVALVTERFRVPREIERVFQGVVRGKARRNRRQIEDREQHVVGMFGHLQMSKPRIVAMLGLQPASGPQFSSSPGTHRPTPEQAFFVVHAVFVAMFPPSGTTPQHSSPG